MSRRHDLPLVYSCSGCSSAAQMANYIALKLDHAGDAEMSCISGVGGNVPHLVGLRELTSHYAPTDDTQLNVLYVALAALDQDLEQHIQAEDEVLFPRMLQLEQHLIA